jgi:hypothetical protein
MKRNCFFAFIFEVMGSFRSASKTLEVDQQKKFDELSGSNVEKELQETFERSNRNEFAEAHDGELVSCRDEE